MTLLALLLIILASPAMAAQECALWPKDVQDEVAEPIIRGRWAYIVPDHVTMFVDLRRTLLGSEMIGRPDEIVVYTSDLLVTVSFNRGRCVLDVMAVRPTVFNAWLKGWMGERV